MLTPNTTMMSRMSCPRRLVGNVRQDAQEQPKADAGEGAMREGVGEERHAIAHHEGAHAAADQTHKEDGQDAAHVGVNRKKRVRLRLLSYLRDP